MEESDEGKDADDVKVCEPIAVQFVVGQRPRLCVQDSFPPLHCLTSLTTGEMSGRAVLIHTTRWCCGHENIFLNFLASTQTELQRDW
jgi:hypothetical protein